MLQANNSKGKLVTLASLSKNQIDRIRNVETFYCPQCESPLIVRAGPRVIPHFAHPTTATCSHASTGESAYHQQGKYLLYQWLRQQHISADLEVYLPDINQRPDILLTYGKKMFAMEFQHTTTTLMNIKKRNEGYKKLNIFPIWVLGTSFFKRTSTNTLQVNDFTLQFVHQFSANLPSTAYFFSPEQQVISIVSDLHLSNRRKATAAITYKKLSQLPFRELFTSKKLTQQQLFASWKHEKRKFRLSTERPFGIELKWRQWLYNHQLHTDHLPSIVHLPTPTQHFFKAPPWQWQSRFIIDFLHPLSIGETFTKNDLSNFFHPYLYVKDEYPLLNQYSPELPYIHLLIKLGYLKQVDEHTFMKMNTIVFYDHIEQAIAGDNELLTYIMYNQT